MAFLSPWPRVRFFDLNGNPLSGGKLFTYDAGTSTPKATYTDSSAGTPNTNPVILDAAGEANVWVDGSYKFILKNSLDVTQWTVDNIVDSSVALKNDLANTSNPALGDALIGVKQPVASGVGRTQHSKNSDMISVKDFGATGNGITDDTTAFAAANSANVGPVYVPPGTYNITSAVAGTFYSFGGATTVGTGTVTINNLIQGVGGVFASSTDTVALPLNQKITYNSDIFSGAVVQAADGLIEDATAANTHLMQQSSSGIAPSVAQSFSVYLRAQGRRYVQLNMVDNASAGNGVSVYFDLQTATVQGAANAGSGINASGSITSAGNGWIRCTLSGTPNNTGTTTLYTVYLSQTGSSTTYSGDGISGVRIWGAQANTGDVANYEPTSGSLGTTNKLLYSEDFTNAAWTKTRSSISSNIYDSPNGQSYQIKADATQGNIAARVSSGSGPLEKATLSQVIDTNLVGEADGDILIRAAGVWNRLGIGSTGQALVVTGGLPSWGVGSPVVNLGTQTATNVASIDYLFPGTTYKAILLIFNLTSSANNPAVRLSTDGATFVTSGYGAGVMTSTSNASQTNATTATVTMDLGPSSPTKGYSVLIANNGGTMYTTASNTSGNPRYDGTQPGLSGQILGVRFLAQAGTISGTVTAYGFI